MYELIRQLLDRYTHWRDEQEKRFGRPVRVVDLCAGQSGHTTPDRIFQHTGGGYYIESAELLNQYYNLGDVKITLIPGQNILDPGFLMISFFDGDAESKISAITDTDISKLSLLLPESILAEHDLYRGLLAH